jgi:hypothetical protein
MWARTIDGEMADFNDRYDEDLDPKLDDPRWSGDEKPWRRTRRRSTPGGVLGALWPKGIPRRAAR